MRGAVAGCVVLLAMSVPAHALVAVIGAGMAHDCFIMAKAGTNPRAAIATCDMALREEALDIRARAGTYVNRGVMKVALGQVDDAMADYNNGLALNPSLGDGYVDRGAALILLKRYDEAMADINRGIGLGQTYEHLGYYNRGVAEFYLGRVTESYHDFKKALEIAPDFTLASEQLKNFVVTRVPAGEGARP
ncbi:MAG TPA: tetratricopeptide repeat protein [Rhizomicrobium sp.]|jgi:tetratricopeptide (TPR) repeat protein|nr:tetratricopeptide repeat protein [Rhizomicrobium sp.]